MFKEVDTSTEYDFNTAWNKLCKGNIMTSKKTMGSYKLDKIDSKEFMLKFQHPMVSIWQECDYVLVKEILDKWYVTRGITTEYVMSQYPKHLAKIKDRPRVKSTK